MVVLADKYSHVDKIGSCMCTDNTWIMKNKKQEVCYKPQASCRTDVPTVFLCHPCVITIHMHCQMESICFIHWFLTFFGSWCYSCVCTLIVNSSGPINMWGLRCCLNVKFLKISLQPGFFSYFIFKYLIVVSWF